MPESKLMIKSDGTPMGTQVLIDGKEVKLPITSIQFQIAGGGSEAIITVQVPELDLTIDDKKVTWMIERPPPQPEQLKFFGEKK